MSDDSGNFCYRHPHRQSYILCQRCGRTVCAACSTPAAVGVHCPECLKEARSRAPRQRSITTRTVRAFRRGSSVPVATYSIMAVCMAVFVLQLVFGDRLTSALVFYPPFIEERPWTLLTSVFAHGGVIHLLLNMAMLFMIGRILEAELGRLRYLLLYLLSGWGGGIAVLYLVGAAHSVLGASGAIFGILGAFVVVAQRRGGNLTQALLLVALNLGLGFFLPSISWQAHVGGLVVGVLIALIYSRTRGPRRRRRQIALVAALAALLVVATVVGALYR